MSVQPRMNRLFSPQGKCFDVAIDHGFFNEYSFLSGIENMKSAVETIVRAESRLHSAQRRPGALFAVDSRQTETWARAPHGCGQCVRKANCRGTCSAKLIDNPVEQAVALDAGCVVVNLLLLPNQPELHHQCVKNVCRLKPQCEKYGMPLMVEPLVMLPNETSGGYMVDGDITKIMPLVRQAVELGADIIKADPATTSTEYHRVIEAASGIPVLARGGGRARDEEIITRTYELMKQGASGIVYGRNVVQHPNPDGMTRALMAIVHDGATRIRRWRS